jgi:hypothetical protein
MAALHRLAVQRVLSSRSADAAMRLALGLLLGALHRDHTRDFLLPKKRTVVL